MYIETIEFGLEMQGGGLLIEEEQGVWSKLKLPNMQRSIIKGETKILSLWFYVLE